MHFVSMCKEKRKETAMQIIPAIDLMGGFCVRLSQGNAGEQTRYAISPLKVMEKFQHAGVEKVHIVDLDGAFSGKIQNKKVIKN